MLSFVSRSVRRLTQAEPDLAVLLQRLAGGDVAALDLLYRREADAVYRFAFALCGNAAWAADATQDAFMALAARPHAYDAGRGSLGAYLAGAARHALLAQWHQARRHEPWPEDEDGADAVPGGEGATTPERLLVQQQDLAQFWEALRSLPWPFREAVVLVDLQERSYADAALVAGIEINTLRTRVHRGRLKLARLLGAGVGATA